MTIDLDRQNLPKLDIIISLVDFAAHENVSVYLVGGSVRDLLLDREIEDLDFAVTGNAFDFTRKFADLINASFVPMDEEHDTARLAFRNEAPRKRIYLDFCGIRDISIESDLAGRDFTINAMAIEISQMMKSNEVVVIDPFSGMESLRNKVIKAVTAKSVEDDPIRMLRAYRFAATLDFRISEITSAAIRNSAKLLNNTSIERIRDELFKLLMTDRSSHYLGMMDEMGLLDQMFPEIASMRGMEQNDYHHLDVWEHSMLTLTFLEEEIAPHSLDIYGEEIEDYLNYESVKGRSRIPLLKLAAMLHDVGKPAVRTMDADGRIRFFEHNLEGAEIISNIGKRFRLATRESESLKEIIKNHMYPLGLCVYLKKHRSEKTKTRALKRFIHRTGPDWMSILLLSFADLRATQGPRRQADDLSILSRLIGEIANIYFQLEQNPIPGLVTGKDIMDRFSIPSSPTIGKLLQRVKQAQFDGKIKTKTEAMEMIKGILTYK